jgi:hypothetical protein
VAGSSASRAAGKWVMMKATTSVESQIRIAILLLSSSDAEVNENVQRS